MLNLFSSSLSQGVSRLGDRIGSFLEQFMGEQTHIGGFRSSMDLAARSGIKPGMRGVDLCCGSGAGVCFLLRMRQVLHMTGIDISADCIKRAYEKAVRYGLEEQYTFLEGNAAETGLPDHHFDFVWSEDGFCFGEQKTGFASEAARLLAPGGILAFTDWCRGPVPMSVAESERFMTFMEIPSLYMLKEYVSLTEFNHLVVRDCSDTQRLLPSLDLYIRMVTEQQAFDYLQQMNFDEESFGRMCQNLLFVRKLAFEKKVMQLRLIAYKPR